MGVCVGKGDNRWKSVFLYEISEVEFGSPGLLTRAFSSGAIPSALFRRGFFFLSFVALFCFCLFVCFEAEHLCQLYLFNFLLIDIF